MMRIFLYLCLNCLLTGPLAAQSLLPHRAVYDIRLHSTRADSDVSHVSGQMLYQNADFCDAWVVHQRYQFDMLYQQGGEVLIRSDYFTWEKKDGTAFSSSYRNYVNNELDEEILANAQRDPENNLAEIRFLLPEEKTINVESGIIYPNFHILNILEEARAGHHALWARSFDGTDAENITEIHTLITPVVDTPGTEESAAAAVSEKPADDQLDTPLAEQQSWHLQLAFYDENSDEPLPMYEISVRLYENGVTDNIVIDYGEFALAANLTEIEPLAPCE